MTLVTLLGYPLEHSISPAMQGAAFEALGLDWSYRATPTKPEDLHPALQALKDPSSAGANVTVPHKESVLRMLDELHPDASAVGAVNTIVNHAGRLTGHNTDLDGFVHDLQSHGVQPAGERALVLGAGGGARAVLFALATRTPDLMMICRRIPQGERVAQDLQAHTGVGLRVCPWDTRSFRAAAEWASLIVNATPMGMYPHADGDPWPADVGLPAGAFLYDLVYNPPVTSLVARARGADLQAETGLGMLVEQGALAFELWTGLDAPRVEMRGAAQAQLEGGYA